MHKARRRRLWQKPAHGPFFRTGPGMASPFFSGEPEATASDAEVEHELPDAARVEEPAELVAEQALAPAPMLDPDAEPAALTSGSKVAGGQQEKRLRRAALPETDKARLRDDDG